MDLIYGTYNPAKFRSMAETLQGLDIRLTKLSDIKLELREAEENGKYPLENAVAKARTYYDQIRRPLFSCDSGLFFEDVEEEDQPGVHIRRVKGKSLTDLEMQSYYSGLAKKYGGYLTAYYKNSICLIVDENKIWSYDGNDLNSEKFHLVPQPHERLNKGFPLDSMSVEIKSKRYYYDIKERRSENRVIYHGFRDFFIRSLKLR